MRKRMVDYAVWLGILLCCTFLVTSLVAVKGAFAQGTSVGKGLICDTPAEIERYIALYKKGDDGYAIAQQVNAEVGKPTACGLVFIVFEEGEEITKVRGEAGPARIVKVTIFAINTGAGFQAIPPYEQYAAFPIPEEGA